MDGSGDKRPVIIALAGSNEAGKTTFYHAHLQPGALRLVNADILARELGIDAYDSSRKHAPAIYDFVLNLLPQEARP
jgi:predicted ABC-type ATPase